MNNKVTLLGQIESSFEHSHFCNGNDFYASKIWVKRHSGICDVIPIVVHQELLQAGENDFHAGDTLWIEGEYRSVNYTGPDGRRHLSLNVYVKEIEKVADDAIHINRILLEGWVVKAPIYRMSTLNEIKITDVIVAVHRNNGSSDYIPCIAWYGNAVRAKMLNVGDKITLWGRIQSRKYVKELKNGEKIEKKAYEVSIKNFI